VRCTWSRIGGGRVPGHVHVQGYRQAAFTGEDKEEVARIAELAIDGGKSRASHRNAELTRVTRALARHLENYTRVELEVLTVTLLVDPYDQVWFINAERIAGRPATNDPSGPQSITRERSGLAVCPGDFCEEASEPKDTRHSLL